jgi:hypothetical protein
VGRVDVDVDAADLRGVLQVAQVEVVAEQPFGLPEDGAHDVGALDHAVGGDVRVDEVFGGVLHDELPLAGRVNRDATAGSAASVR